MIKKGISLGVLALVLGGCGTVNTVLQGDDQAAHDLRKQKTYCQTIPHIYSGVTYDFCILNAPPEPAEFLMPLMLVDLLLSGVMDTVLLPYTVYRQVIDGNITIYR
ncbi:hypothetical protein D3C80_1790670 [compost metagenome]